MKIIIIGDGKVGYNLADKLSKDHHDVTMIDKNADRLREVAEDLDVQCVRGNGLSTRVMLEAGIRDADLMIAVTLSDEMNVVCCMTGKRLGAKHAIARIRDPEYADELSALKGDLGLDLVINPEQAIAREIAKLLEFPSAVSVEMFAKGHVEMVEIKVTADMPLAHLALKNISQKISSSILIGAVLRAGEVFIPSGDFVIAPDDLLYLFGHPARIYHFCAKIGIPTPRVKNAMIVGGGKIAYYLAKSLHEIGIAVKIIEIDYARCVELSEALPNALIIHGNGSDDRLMHAENIAQMDCLISITGSDEENFMTALLAKRLGVPKAIAKINRNSYWNLGIDIDNLVSPKAIVADHIARFVRGLSGAMNNPGNLLYRIIGEQAEIVEFTADESAVRVLHTPLKKLPLKKNVLVGIIVRNNTAIIPHGNDVIKPRDSVILITKGPMLESLGDIIASED